MSDAELVCGIDVGSQGSCLAVFDADGERLATSYQPHKLAYPRPGWAEQDPRDWRAAVVNGFRDLSARVNLRRVRADLVRLAARRPRVRRPERPAGGAGDHLDGPARRPALPGRRGADRAGRVVRAVGLQPRRLARRRQDRLGRSRAARRERAHRPLPPPRGLHGAGRLRRRRRRPLERVVDDGARSRHWGRGTTTCSRAFGIDPARLPPVVGADEPLGEITAAFAADTGLPPSTIVVCGCGDEMAATLGAGLAEPGSDLRRPRHRRAGLRRLRPPAARSDADRRVPPPRRTRAGGCSRARDGRPAPRIGGSATSSAAGSTTTA